MNRPWRRLEKPSLRWTRRRGLRPGQVQQPAQPRVLRPQLREFPGHRHWYTADNECLVHKPPSSPQLRNRMAFSACGKQ
jgi:hypothetical protein